MGQLLIWGALVTSWRLWFMVLLEPFSMISQPVIHSCVSCIPPKTAVGILSSLYNEYFILRCGPPPTEGSLGRQVMNYF